MEDLQPQAAAAATLCETCSGFDWTTWLRDKIVQAYILHSRFENVINAALAGCRLCAFVIRRYNNLSLADETRRAHLGLPMAVETATSVFNSNTILDLRMYLVCGGPELTPVQRIEAKHAAFSTYFGMSVPTCKFISLRILTVDILNPLASWEDLQQRCAVRSYHDLQGFPSVYPLPCRLTWLRERIAECCDSPSHKSCRRSPDGMAPKMPTRVIDCEELRLVETRGKRDGDDVRFKPYAILSHCWGTKWGLRTTQSNYAEMCLSIQLDILPATIRDAIIFSQRIGYRYIWIDSLCIIQPERPGDLNEQGDWNEELPNMHIYYKNADVALVIESAAGDEDGFLANVDFEGKQDTCDTPRPIPIPVKLGVRGSSFFQIDFESHKQMAIMAHRFYFSRGTPLRKRAWTLQ
jgi:hypothetical protein